MRKPIGSDGAERQTEMDRPMKYFILLHWSVSLCRGRRAVQNQTFPARSPLSVRGFAPRQQNASRAPPKDSLTSRIPLLLCASAQKQGDSGISHWVRAFAPQKRKCPILRRIPKGPPPQRRSLRAAFFPSAFFAEACYHIKCNSKKNKKYRLQSSQGVK